MMQKILNQDELEITQELINVGLKGAAKAFSSIAGGNISISSSEVGLDDVSGSLSYNSSKGENVHVLLTRVKGQIEGACFLLFSEEEVENLLDTSLTPEIRDQPHKRKMMADTFLMETDNIISASVITQFSNLLDKMIYGDVPYLHKMTNNKVEEFISGFKNEHDHLLLFKTKFEADHIDINPEFVWLMKEDFADGVRDMMKQDNFREKLANI